MYIQIDETVKEGNKRWAWPWHLLESVGDHFVVRDPKNIKNARQSIHQFNKRSGTKVLRGASVGDGYKVEKIV